MSSIVMKVVVTLAVSDELTIQNLLFLRPTLPGCNFSINKKYGVILFLPVVTLDKKNTCMSRL